MVKETEIAEFLDFLYKYVCLSGNASRIKNEIGVRRAIVLKTFLCEYLEHGDENVQLYAKNFLENTPLFGRVIREG